MYRSPTAQLESVHAFTFDHLVVDETGACITAERKGLRNMAKKGLVVRYPNPFQSDEPPEVLLEAADAMHCVARTSDGALHAASQHKHYERPPGGGAWKNKAVIEKGSVDILRDVGNEVLALSYSRGKDFGTYTIHQGRLGAWRARTTTKDNPYDLVALSADVALFATPQGMYRLRGSEVEELADGPTNAHFTLHGGVAYASGAPGVVVARYDGSRFVTVVERGAVADASLCDGWCHLGSALGRLWVTASRRVSILEGNTLRGEVELTGYANNSVVGNDQVAWIPNGVELLCTDGKSWRSVLRVRHAD